MSVTILAAAASLAVGAGCAGQSRDQGAAGPSAVAQPATPAAASPAATPTAATVSPSPASATLIVHGMGCPLCANNVDKQLLKVPGVRRVNVDLGSGKVKVAFAPGAPFPGNAKLEKAVANSGYTLVRIQTP